MKQVFITGLFLFVAQCGWSQLEMKLKPRLSLQDKDSVVVSKGDIRAWRNSSPLRYVTIPKADSFRFSHTVAAGSVYSLRQDNMPCLKPATDLVYNMPVQNLSGNNNMPNAYQPPQSKLLQLLPKQFQKN